MTPISTESEIFEQKQLNAALLLLIEILKEKGILAKDIAAVYPCSVTYFSQIKKAKRPISYTKLFLLAEKFGVMPVREKGVWIFQNYSNIL